jgi:anti-sigma factor RsiW
VSEKETDVSEKETALSEEDWEQQINALIDGELGRDEVAALMAAAAQEPEFRRQLETAQQLQQVLHQLPAQRAPRSLRRKLRRIGEADRNERAASIPWWRWGAIAVSIPVLLMVSIGDKPQVPSTAEIEQGRRDLAVALGYLGRAGQKVALEVDLSISRGVVGSIRENTVQALRHQIDTQEELLL